MCSTHVFEAQPTAEPTHSTAIWLTHIVNPRDTR